MILVSPRAVQTVASISMTISMQSARRMDQETLKKIKAEGMSSSRALLTFLANHTSSSLSAMSEPSTLRVKVLRSHQDQLLTEPRSHLNFHKSTGIFLRLSCITQARYSLLELVIQLSLVQEPFKSGNFHLKSQVRFRLILGQSQESDLHPITRIFSLLVKMDSFVSLISRIEIQRVKKALNCSSNSQRKS